MPKSNSRGFGRTTAISVIGVQVHRQYARAARIGYTVTAVITTALGMTIASAYVPPVVAVFLGVIAGIACGAVVFVAVRIWPAARFAWWWLPEISAITMLLWLWSILATHAPIPVRGIVMAAVLGSLVPRWTRGRFVAILWCVVVRHRLRSCFAQFIVANRSGSLPLILGARPTPVGERVWIYLRSGLSAGDLEHRADKIAVACHASSVVVERASSKTAALVRLDIKRREVLTRMVSNPVVGLITPETFQKPGLAGHDGLNLEQLPAQKPALAPPQPSTKSGDANLMAKVPGAVMRDGEDVSDWID
jgi:hypothetical protein